MSISTRPRQAESTKGGGRSRNGSTAKSRYFVWIAAAVALLMIGLNLLNRSTIPGNDLQPLTSVDRTGGGGPASVAPDFALPKIGGGRGTLTEYRGSVVMLNFWATWCGPCKREIPDFIALQTKYKSKGFTILGVALDDAPAVETYVKSARINYPILIGDGAVAQAYGGVRSIPTTFLIDRDGRVVTSQIGMQPAEFWDKAIAELL